MDENYQNLKFATLFHDIGKFYQRAFDNASNRVYDSKYDDLENYNEDAFGEHSKWSADFVKRHYNETIENLVLNHHISGDDKLLNILQKSNYHSSHENRIDEKDSAKGNLISVFSKIKLTENNNVDNIFVPLESLKLDESLYPIPEEEKLNYKNLWEDFLYEFEKIPNLNDFETVFAIVKKYTSTIPLKTYDCEEDISLFNHLKTSVCLSNCNYLFSLDNELNESNIYTIISGDISGIQDFIYRVSSPKDAQKDMSKRLRGRSIYLSLLSEAITTKIIDELNLDSSNILFCGGGRFTIIAPNIKKTHEIIDDIRFSINTFFIDDFNAELYLALNSVNASNEDLMNFNMVLSKLNNKLSENKKCKFNIPAIGDFECSNLLEYLFKQKSDNCYVKDLCHVCGEPTTNPDFCDKCNGHVNLGRDVSNAKFMIKYIGDEIPKFTSFYNEILNVGFLFLKDNNIPNLPSDLHYHVYSLNNTEFLDLYDFDTSLNVSFDFKFFGNNVPAINNKKTLYFEHLAQCSKGSDKLGVLKMDVDNLGKIFSQGFYHLKDSNISRISSLSFNMDLFFSGFINNIINEFLIFIDDYDSEKLYKVGNIRFEGDDSNYNIYKPKDRKDIPDDFKEKGIPTIYVNYSGGDDLLVVGPYDDIIEFAFAFKNKFKEWTCNNDSINISAGIKIFGSKFPIGKAAILADDDLEKSKDCGRNKITLFNQILAWEGDGQFYPGFDSIFEFSKKLEKLREEGKISGGFVYSLLHVWEYKTSIGELQSYDKGSWLDYNRDKHSKKSFIPLLYYKLRIIKDRETRDKLRDELKDILPWIKVPVSWSSLRLR